MGSLDSLVRAIQEYDADGARNWAAKAMEEGADPLVALDAVAAVMKGVGDRFGREELWLPELIGAADAAMAGLDIVEKGILATGREVKRLGTVVIGTVFGDINTVGKSMVSALLTANGFKVVDLGTNVPAEQFVAAVEREKANILGMSALLTTTAPEQRKVIEALKNAGMRGKVKVMVGGGAITSEFAQQIGADGYRATAPEAVDLALALLSR